MSAKRGPVTSPEDARRARVLPHVDRVRRISSMLERWASEDVGDEPDWELDEVERISLRTPAS